MSSSVSRLVSSVCKKIIKPYSPTPISLRCHKLSYLDQMVGGIYLPLALFYPKLSNTWSNKPNNVVSQHLEKSLSKVLTNYYPFAGKLNDNISIDCNDSGVEFFITKINCPMSEIFNHPYFEKHNLVYPTEVINNQYTYEGSLAVFQLTHFSCGGIAISMCLSHKVGDGYTFGNFMNHWATIARNPLSSEIYPISPKFDGSFYFPPTKDEDSSNVSNNNIMPQREECVSKGFSISSSKLTALKVRVINDSQVQNPSDTEVVSAFLYQRAMATKKLVNSSSIRPSLLHQAVNLRPPVPKHTMGNIGSLFSILTKEEKEMDLAQVVSKLRKEKEEVKQKYKNAKIEELLPITLEQYRKANDLLVNNSCYDLYRFSSLITFPSYDVDFGWGKPEKVISPLSTSNPPIKNMFVLMDDKNRDGVNLTCSMKKQDMLAFERDEELLRFASPTS
uniref:Acylsucrose acyltransferase 2 n=1 Tax=Solanum habrochaites TaxID=62890 RepID=A0A2H5ABU2_SOLHA|nr:acylsucrose acyltransferase 2 [Solanum habrochaites]